MTTIADHGLVMQTERGRAIIETIVFGASLGAALALFLDSAAFGNVQSWWFGAAFGMLASSAVAFGIVPSDGPPNRAVWGWITTRLLIAIMLLLGLANVRFPRRGALAATLIAGSAVTLLAFGLGASLPSLVIGHSGRFSEIPAGGLTDRYWLLSTMVAAVSLTAALITVQRQRRGQLEFWLAVAIILFLAAQLSAMFAPSPYTRFLTTTDLFRVGFAAVVMAGSGSKLARIARERELLLDIERRRVAALERTALARGEFAALISHELLLPLSAIRALADAAAHTKVRPGDRAKALALLGSEISVLSDLVGEINAASEIESASFTIDRRPVSVEQLVENLAEWTAALPGDHPVTLTMTSEKAAIVLADAQRIRQVLKNLLSNAAKYSPAGSPIALHVVSTPRGVGMRVEDRGFGIAPQDRPRIFQKFGRGDAAEVRGIRGLGLGLFLAERIVATHVSELRVESTLGRGSTFSFDLPAAR